MIEQEIIEAYEAWWEHRNDAPVIAYPYDKPEVDVYGARKPWMRDNVEPLWAICNAIDVMNERESDDLRYIDDAIDYLERSIDAQDFLGAGLHSRPFMLGPGSIAASIRGYFKFLGNSVWFEKDDDPMEYRQIPSSPPDPPNHFDELSFLAANRLAERLGGKLVIGHADLGGILDILASLRTTNELLVDTIDEDEETIHTACRKIEAVWHARYAAYDSIFAAANDGLRTSWMPIPSRKTYFPLQNDFGAMISPGMFENFAIPSLDRLCSNLDRAIFHLDGKEMIPHVNAICSLETVRAIQWTPGAGNPEPSDPCWWDLYKQIIDNGKNVVILGFPPEDTDGIRRLFATLPASAFYILSWGEKSKGEAFLKAAGM